jgi:hypothetical protein
MSRIVWKPQPKQEAFMRRTEDEVFFGGAAGGGKSDAIVIEALRQVHIPNYKALILRKTYKNLTELIEKSQLYYPQAFPKARYNGTMHEWRFPSGAKIIFGNVRDTTYKIDYQGKQYDFIGFDELTHFTYEQYAYICGRNRPSGPGTICYVRATGNPGNIGHGWVKDRFVTAAEPMTRFVNTLEVEMPDGSRKQLTKSACFVPSTVFDNQALLDNDPNYLAQLASLPEAEKRAMLYGDWNSFSGQVFREFRDLPQHYKDREWTHVIEPFPIPKHWQIVRSYDWGFNKPFSLGWWAVDEMGCMYRVRELYGCVPGSPNTGVQWPDQKIAREILRIESEDPNIAGHEITGVADPAIGLDKETGYGAAANMAKEGVYFQKAMNSRIKGKMQFHYRLAFNDEGHPMMQVFNTCVNFIRQIPALVYSEVDVEDIDTKQEDHIYDESRYALCTRMISAPRKNPEEIRYTEPDDPLNMIKDKDKTRYISY